ncbi:hypothetical protein BO94DRAFT_572630 [Aspergillus sclerotioniger CBS 115572]|uniref:Uncharacterized protein n=1 Tax=Aspergillus sclerotioniger CBS 115572 TaxID=1450535 RepID=A0A317XAZ8_9EURO|nr:hypothetical protein BO94DRAFT_572630 [Aspergillus sclerotioniger CBS 115572]PWY94118.1 hypothetical protein BO94DRAFT_572630 [Aspergillus sclerotioniger CBS 115572]
MPYIPNPTPSLPPSLPHLLTPNPQQQPNPPSLKNDPHPPHLILITLLLLIPPPVTPWTLTLRNSSTTSGTTIIHETTPQPCTPIHHQKGYEFSFDPEGPWCLDFWREDTCVTRIGWSCDGLVWRKVASQNLSAFDVYGMPDGGGSVTGVGAGAATGTGTTTSQQGDGNVGVKLGSRVSGGVIAGIVVGSVAGLLC